MESEMSFEKLGYQLGQGEGDRVWFLGTLMTIKAGHDDTAGAYTLVEQTTPALFGPPLHVHHAEDEAFYILEGALHVVCGDQGFDVGAGSFVMLPRGIPHAFQVGDSGARLLQLTSPAGFENFAHDVGEAATSAELPPPAAPDIPRLVAAAERHGASIVGPPLGSHA
jgi:mannose-6-phosphate isomerase-like protein (cupin superfamily)